MGKQKEFEFILEANNSLVEYYMSSMSRRMMAETIVLLQCSLFAESIPPIIHADIPYIADGTGSRPFYPPFIVSDIPSSAGSNLV